MHLLVPYTDHGHTPTLVIVFIARAATVTRIIHSAGWLSALLLCLLGRRSGLQFIVPIPLLVLVIFVEPILYTTDQQMFLVPTPWLIVGSVYALVLAHLILYENNRALGGFNGSNHSDARLAAGRSGGRVDGVKMRAAMMLQSGGVTLNDEDVGVWLALALPRTDLSITAELDRLPPPDFDDVERWTSWMICLCAAAIWTLAEVDLGLFGRVVRWDGLLALPRIEVDDVGLFV